LFHIQKRPLSGDANDTTSRAKASVSGLLGLRVVALAEIINAGVDDDSSANDALRSNELDKLVCDRSYSVALSVGLDVSQVTDVTLLISRGTVGLGEWVEVRTS